MNDIQEAWLLARSLLISHLRGGIFINEVNYDNGLE